ncbi:MAG: homogentisate 1,2-dioxygenase [Myxococcales bacterium]|nr:homogentisate 1,2-dioxygenase [Myxococcales bacterium]
MLDRMVAGEVPAKHHTQLRGPGGELRYEECFTRDGFDGPYTILYHQFRPQTQTLAPAAHGWAPPSAAADQPLAKRHYVTDRLGARGGAQLDARVALLFNEDVTSGVAFPDADDPVISVNGDGDELIYVHRGDGRVRTPMGEVTFSAGDYVFVPRGVPHRYLLSGPQTWFWMQLSGGLHVPRQWRNDVGQLRMDAPYCHRDFIRPVFAGPTDDGVRDLVVKQGERWHGFRYQDSPFDVVGWDGTVYPWAFPILKFQPRVSSVHLPPTWHGTFAARGALVCSFVPRLVDFHPDAIPCPYPHSSTHCDEIIFYCDGNFTSRRGVGPGSISHHPAGIPHGPHPGSYERSIGTTRTDELAVMLDTFRPLRPTAAALPIEDAGYQQSFL